MKRFLTILCALALSVIVCFAGCSDGDNPSKGNGGGNNTQNSDGSDGDWTGNY